jgi:hypothetical protein
MSGHKHIGGPQMTQNQGNIIGDRPCVRQSKLFREHDGGNAMKDLMGQGQLKWDTNKCEGAYSGNKVYDHNNKSHTETVSNQPMARKGSLQQAPAQAQPGQQQPQATATSGRRGVANRQSYNLITGEDF